MNDRSSTKVLANGAIRYEVYTERGEFLRYEYIKPGDEPTQEGMPICKATLFSDAAAGVCGLPNTATPNDGFIELGTRANNALVRDLNIMLNLSLGTSNIDAWADLLGDENLIDVGKSSAYTLESGSLSKGFLNATGSTGNVIEFGRQTGNNYTGQRAGQSFIALSNTIYSIEVSFSKRGSPSDSVKMAIYTATNDLPTDKLYESTNSIPASYITGDTDYNSQKFKFDFSNVNLTKGTKYCFVLERTGSLSDSNYYMVGVAGEAPYANGLMTVYRPYSWSTYPGDIRFKMDCYNQGEVIWKSVVPTSVFKIMAISTVQSLGSGTITFFVSDDGITWTKITALNTGQAVNFTKKAAYLKAVITGSARLESVAWGGL